MCWNRSFALVPLALALLAGSGCKSNRERRPKELASLSPAQACRHFFGRVRTCSGSINRIQAAKLGLKGRQRQAFLRQRADHLARVFRAPDLICERYALKTRKQQTDMDRCYRERTCDAFAACFVQMADAEMSGMGIHSMQDLRKRLQELNRQGQMGGAHPHPGHPPHTPPGVGAPAPTAPRAAPGPQPRTTPRPKPKPVRTPVPRPKP